MGPEEAALPWGWGHSRRWGRAGLRPNERGLRWVAPLRVWVQELSGIFRKGPGTQGSGLQMESVPYKASGTALMTAALAQNALNTVR